MVVRLQRPWKIGPLLHGACTPHPTCQLDAGTPYSARATQQIRVHGVGGSPDCSVGTCVLHGVSQVAMRAASAASEESEAELGEVVPGGGVLSYLSNQRRAWSVRNNNDSSSNANDLDN